MRQRAARPSPAIVIAVIALVAALAGTAVAGQDATTKALTASKVKRIVNTQIKKRVLTSEPYHVIGTAGEPGFLNGWHNGSSLFKTAGFYKDPLGVVHLRGFIEGHRVINDNGGLTASCEGGGTCEEGMDGLVFRVP
jgi:hypothetical protein